MEDTPLNIRPLATIAEFEEAGEVQRRAWNITDERQIVPSILFLTAQKEGGLVAGAFTDSGEMIGFLYGFVGIAKDGRFKHCSHMMGIVPEYRRQSVGYRLKCFQRQYVLKQDLDLVTWTFDPLEGLNAMLNVAKLGGVVRKYYPNLYGEWQDGINKGLPTDRFEIEWWIKSERVHQFVDTGRARVGLDAILESGVQSILAAEFDSHGVPHPIEVPAALNVESLLIEVPADFQSVKQLAMDTAREWRHKTALLFTHCFGEGFLVADFISHVESLPGENHQRRRNFFYLTKRVEGLTL